MKIGIIGATGLIGSHLVREAKKAGHEVAGFSRRADRDIAGADETRSIRRHDQPDFSGLDTLVVVAGASVFGLWTQEKKEAIRSSRIGLMRQVRERLAVTENGPKRIVSASAIGFYGDRGDEILEEGADAGSGFLAQTCIDWEQEAQEIETLGLSVVMPRVGLVLAKEGPAHKMMKLGFGLGLGGRLGDGSQWMPWIHLEDIVRIFLYCCENQDLTGPLNATAPHPETNQEFTETMARVMHRPAKIPAPKWLLQKALGEASDLFLGSVRATPRRLMDDGFQFEYETLEPALRAVFR